MAKDAKTLKAELRALRKESQKPVSRMRVADISAEIERLKLGREETPAVGAISSSPTRISKSAVESVKAAKAAEWPIEPAAKAGAAKKMPKEDKVPVAKAKAPPAPQTKKSSKMERLMALLESDDE